MWQEQIEIEYLDIRKENKNRFYKTLNSGKKMAKKKRGKGEETKRQKEKVILENNFFFLEQDKNQQKRGVSRKGSP